MLLMMMVQQKPIIQYIINSNYIQIDVTFALKVNVCFGQEIFFAFSAGFFVLFAAGSLVRRVRRDPTEVPMLNEKSGL